MILVDTSAWFASVVPSDTDKVVMEKLGVNQAFSFDRHFHQFGSISVFP